MLRKQAVPDKVLLKRVNQRLMRAGLGAGCSVRVAVRNGQVTISGTIQRDLQRRPTLRAATGIDGVRQVIDQLKVEAKKERLQPTKAKVEAVPLVVEAVSSVVEAVPLVVEAVPLVVEAVPLVVEAVPLVVEAEPLCGEAGKRTDAGEQS